MANKSQDAQKEKKKAPKAKAESSKPTTSALPKAKETGSTPIKIVSCDCISEFQDSKYGKGKRVANKCGKTAKATGYRCTTCNRNH